MPPIIQVSNLSKSYSISHEGRERYTSLRDVIARKTKKIFSFPKSMTATSATKEEFWALKDVSFDIEQGDRVGIIGRNGAGKSTLLKILSRITEPTTGSIKIKGRVASLLEVGTGFHPELTGRENIYLNGAILGMSRAEIKKHFDAIVDFAETEKFLDTPVKRYSSGMYVRLAFAVAAHLEPEILVVDEVLAVGDAQFQKKCLNKINDVSKNEGRTVIFVSHNMPAVKQICSNGILLIDGNLAFNGIINETISKYLINNKANDINHIYEKNELENKDVQLIEAELMNEMREVKSEFDISENIFVRLKIVCQKKVPNIYAYISVENDQEDQLIESDTFDYLPNILDDMVIGVNEYIVKITKNVLPIGEFKFYINFTSTFANQFHIDSPKHILKFSIKDTGTKRGMNRKALTSQLLKWENYHVNK